MNKTILSGSMDVVYGSDIDQKVDHSLALDVVFGVSVRVLVRPSSRIWVKLSSRTLVCCDGDGLALSRTRD